MPGGWSENLTYAYLERLMDAARARYELRPLQDGPPAAGDPPRALLRHDVDVSLQSALALAEREAGWGVSSTYLVQVDCPLYRLEGADAREILATLVALGHEVGLHVDVGALAPEALEGRVAQARDRLEAVTEAPVRSVSFHRPAAAVLRGPSAVCGMINAYAEELMEAYISDSEGRFRHGDPLRSIQEQRGQTLQLLIHPVWWADRHLSPGDRLQGLFEESTRGMGAEEAERFDAELLRAVEPAQRSGRA